MIIFLALMVSNPSTRIVLFSRSTSSISTAARNFTPLALACSVI